MVDAVVPSGEAVSPEGERIAKRLARAGLCSRRDAERWIAEGRVRVNDTVLTSPAVVVGTRDRIFVDGQPVPEREPTRLWRYHKPEGLVTTARDEKGRPTVFDKLPADMPRVVSIGRLDLTTEGLLLLTNDGALARHLELPATGWPRRYRVRVFGLPDPQQLAALMRGITLDGVSYGPIEAVLDRQQGSNAWLTVTLREGKNREVRKVLEHLGLGVNRLIRVAYGPFQLGKLERGAVEEVPRRVLRDQLGIFLRDLDAPSGGAGRVPATAPTPVSTPRLAPRVRPRKPPFGGLPDHDDRPVSHRGGLRSGGGPAARSGAGGASRSGSGGGSGTAASSDSQSGHRNSKGRVKPSLREDGKSYRPVVASTTRGKSATVATAQADGPQGQRDAVGRPTLSLGPKVKRKPGLSPNAVVQEMPKRPPRRGGRDLPASEKPDAHHRRRPPRSPS